MTTKDYTEIIGVNTNTAPAQNKKNLKGIEPEIQYQEMSLLQRAIHFRDFEIEMSWKRATYFTLFLSAIFVAYYTIKSNSEMCVAQYISNYGLNNALLICKNANITTKFLAIMLPALGTFISWVWYLVNRGSKQTYENWEHHIDCIEKTYDKGTIYSQLSYKKSPHLYKLLKPYPISASKANNFISLIITLVFGICFIFEFIDLLKIRSVCCIFCCLVFILLAVATYVLLHSVKWLQSSGYENCSYQEDSDKKIFYFHNRITGDDSKYIYPDSKKTSPKKDK